MSQVEFSAIQEMVIAPGDIFWCREQGRKIKIARFGQVINQKLVGKFAGKKFKFEINEQFLLSVDGRDQLIALFEQLAIEKLEVNRIHLAKEILHIIFVVHHRKVSFLDLMHIGLRVFYQFSPPLTEELADVDIYLFQRSTILGIYSVLLAMSLGHLEFNFLQDVYHVCFLFDCYFTQQQVSYHITEALEIERREGKGKQFLEKFGNDLIDFERHPEESLRVAKRKFKDVFHYPEILQIIRLHHEKIDGLGFSSGLNDEDFSDLERAIIFLSEVLPFKNLIDRAEAGTDFLYNHLAVDKTKHFFSPRLSMILNETLAYLTKLQESAQ